MSPQAGLPQGASQMVGKGSGGRLRRWRGSGSGSSGGPSTRPTSATWPPPSTSATRSHLDRLLLVVTTSPGRRSGAGRSARRSTAWPWWTLRCAAVEGLEASSIEIEPVARRTRRTPWPPSGPRTRARDLFVILGSDAAAGLPPGSGSRTSGPRPRSWWSSGRARRRCRRCPGWRWERVEVPSLEVSSTELRTRAEAGRPLDFLVTHEVLECIAERGLYGQRRQRSQH